MVEKQDFEALIVRYLEGAASPEEAMLLEGWKSQSPKNRQLYEQYERLFTENRFNGVDIESAWNQVYGKASVKAKVVPLKNWRYWAASVAALVMVSLLLVQFLGSDNQKPGKINPPEVAGPKEESNILYAKNGVQSFNLYDSSKVELKDGSSLALSENFNSGDRRAKLNGSGRFTVVHDEKHPFVIDVEGLEVFDIGTVFDITTNKDTVKVVVHEGAVELRKNGKVLAMAEGDSAFYLISQELIKQYPTPISLEGVTEVFDDVPLEVIINRLQELFKRKMVIKGEGLKKEGFTMSFDDAELPEVIGVLEANGLRIVQINGIIEISW